MAGGFAKDGAVQDQIDATVEPEARQKAVPGVRLCINCQSELDKENKKTSGYNRRGSKDSQLR